MIHSDHQRTAVLDYVVKDLKSLGLNGPIDLNVPLVGGLGLDEEDWAMDLLPGIKKRFEVKLDDLLLTNGYGYPNWFERVILRWKPWRLSRDVTAQEIIDFVGERASKANP